MPLSDQISDFAAQVRVLEAERDSLRRENRRLRLQLKSANPTQGAAHPSTSAEILGVSPDADAAEVMRAFRNLSKQHHPDLVGGTREKFEQLVQARDLLLSRRS